jgi:hypothetical protein
LARRQKENDALELLKTFKATAMRTFIDFITDVRVSDTEAWTGREANMHKPNRDGLSQDPLHGYFDRIITTLNIKQCRWTEQFTN